MSEVVPHEMSLLGSWDLRMGTGGESDALLRQPKRFALLAYLAVQSVNGWVSREHVLGMFWPQVDEHHARGSLRQSVRFLRTQLGADAVRGRGSELRVDSDRVRCDAVRFRELVSDGAVEEAVTLYRGPFLHGFRMGSDDHAFEDWADRRRIEYRGAAASAAWSAAEAYEEAERLQEAAFWGKRALGLSPFDEVHVRRLMLLLDRVGDRAGALRAYRGLERWLDSELESTPSPETQEISRRVRERSEPRGEAMAGFGTRRMGVERRRSERRIQPGLPAGDERRSGADRRAGLDRRIGRDRRTTG